jgi:hypothetical protein
MNTSILKITEKYEDRPVEFGGIWEDGQWKFKIYRITHKKNTPADERTLEIAKDFAKDVVLDYTTKYEIAAPSYGLGYIILHKGMDSNFIVVSWWSGENMLVTRSMLASLNDQYNYFEITESGMNVCVWDMLIHSFERNSWVKNILESPYEPHIDMYMQNIYKK